LISSKFIIGVGINVNNNISSKLSEIAISLEQITNKEQKIESILESFLKNFEDIKSLNSKDLLDLYKKNSSLIGKEIKVKSINKTFSGKAVDIDNNGNLLLETEKGIIKLNEGDISIL
jgi:BirA family biotin operon repressor/biotin-[acetyl-CoA-carboxylase] ligase